MKVRDRNRYTALACNGGHGFHASDGGNKHRGKGYGLHHAIREALACGVRLPDLDWGRTVRPRMMGDWTMANRLHRWWARADPVLPPSRVGCIRSMATSKHS